MIPTPIATQQSRWHPRNPANGIPASEWSTVLQCVLEKNEPLREVADDYGVSHETIRRLIRAASKKQTG
jgi:Sigma-70, region 4